MFQFALSTVGRTKAHNPIYRKDLPLKERMGFGLAYTRVATKDRQCAQSERLFPSSK